VAREFLKYFSERTVLLSEAGESYAKGTLVSPRVLLVSKIISMKNRLKNSIITPLMAVSVFAGSAMGIGALASAQTPAATNTPTQNASQTEQGQHRLHTGGPMMHHGRGVMGTVSAVSGTTVTVTNADGTSYTVDAASAKVSKIVDLTVGDIKVGDTIGVMGTVSGTNVTAAHIMDGVPPAPAHAPAQQ
jgi:hypothetical protein